ncbi:class I SAM-dependent RNA methyltransferase [Nocardioides sp.]|uniref:class I SAM-dependent RNA methyltransferase n=1 Tax=Nocardioides sp. TaxID=35761 RepID=UPI0027224268|nr:TRAM domain-containing protein [Nocardioides sp.]MDO9456525.1 methyltransferase [Nocardioides sp.]
MTRSSGRRPRTRTARGASRVGERFEVEVGPVGHGGFCVARHEGRAVFVRHALPGERVVVAVTEGTEGDRFWRADAVEVLEPSEHRVEPPCPYAGPDACGGCDLQHVAVPHQRELKATVVAEQLRRLAGLDVEVVVEPVPGDTPVGSGLGWRTRQRYARLPAAQGGGPAMRKHRSHDLVPVDQCLLEAPDPSPHVVRGMSFAVAADGFWQVHPGAPEVLVDAVLAVLEPRAGESVLDLYAGVGLFARFLAEAVGDPGLVTMVEGDRTASAYSLDNVAGATALAGDVGTVLSGLPTTPVDLVVLDPPREGAKRAVVEQVVGRAPRAVAYVACDPAALARDVAIFAEHGYGLVSLRAFDLFPMTHHVECVALLTPRAG